jgi:hypothetical protein
MKKEVFPWAYWNLAPKARWFGATNTFFKPTY